MDYDRLWKRFEELQAECDRRGEIIAEKVLGWKLYKVSNCQQEAYAPNLNTALTGIGLGNKLSKLVDDAIKEMHGRDVEAESVAEVPKTDKP